MNNKTRNIFFIVFALLASLAALYHVIAIIASSCNFPMDIFGTDRSPIWRHALFTVIGIISIYGSLKRPRWFVWFVGVLTVQQWYSHGGYALRLWRSEHTIHWISIAVIILLPIVFGLLLADRRTKV